MLGLLSATAKSSMRPPMVAGPISRNSRFFSLSTALACPASAAGAFAASALIQMAIAEISPRAFAPCFIVIPSTHKARHVTPAGPFHASYVSGRADKPCATSDAPSCCHVSVHAHPQSVRKVLLTSMRWPECELMRSQFAARARLLVVEQSVWVCEVHREAEGRFFSEALPKSALQIRR